MDLFIKSFIRAIPSLVPEVVSLATTAEARIVESSSSGSSASSLTGASSKVDQYKLIGEFKSPLGTRELSIIESLTNTLDKVVVGLTAVMRVLALLVNNFKSFTFLLQGLVKIVRVSINSWLKDLAGTGVFVNVSVPPAFFKDTGKNLKAAKMSTGGYSGFLSRFTSSCYNTTDPNRPVFSDKAIVGGFVMLVDTESLDEFFRAVAFLNNAFSFMNLIPIETSLPPPRNVKAVSGTFEDKDGKKKLGVQLTWESPRIRGNFRYKISRSQVSGGEEKEVNDIPNRILDGPNAVTRKKERGLFQAVKYFISTQEWPKKIEKVYDDPTFNGGSPVETWSLNPLVDGGYYTDFDVLDENPPKRYYYIIQAGFGTGLYGAPSSEVVVSVEYGCIDPSSVGIVQNVGFDGRMEIETLGVGWDNIGGLGRWSSIRTEELLWFIDPVAKLIDGFLERIEGMLKTNSQAIIDMLDGIQAKIQKWIRTIQAIKELIAAILRIFDGLPAIYTLMLPAQSGGVSGFNRRLRSALPPAGRSFSGSNGITLGIVFLYGAVSFDFRGQQSDINDQIKKINKAFNLLKSSVSKD